MANKSYNDYFRFFNSLINLIKIEVKKGDRKEIVWKSAEEFGVRVEKFWVRGEIKEEEIYCGY